ncbi:MAG: hypothetical protein FWD81_01465 [Methanomassiliicoccaceae archaeon]|nr:hypothetical protein [Methanomassiliicoccaceae archaeon]
MSSIYEVSSLNNILHKLPEKFVSETLSSFSCKRDKDVEFFLKEKAIVQEKKHISRTYLIFTTEPVRELVAYFTIDVNSTDGNSLQCSNSLQKKMNIHNNTAQSYLIGQLGKRDGSEKGLGKFALYSAINLIRSANLIVGCRLIRLDCRPSLEGYYADNEFMFARRNKNNDLSQMVRIIDVQPLPSAVA